MLFIGALTGAGPAAGQGQGASGRDRPGRTDRNGDPLPRGAVARFGTTRLQHAGLISALAFSPDGKLLASAGTDQATRVWDVRTGKPLKRLWRLDEDYDVMVLQFSPDGKTLYSCAGAAGSPRRGDMVRIWDLSAGKARCPFLRSEEYGHLLAVSPDATVVASAGTNTSITLWDLRAGRRLREVPASRHGKPLAFSPDGKILVWGRSGVTDRIHFSDVATGAERIPPLGPAVSCGAAAFSPDGRMLASSNENGDIHLWEMSTWRERLVLRGHKETVKILTFSANGKSLASADWKTVRLWNMHTGRPDRQLPALPEVFGLALSPDGRTLATGGWMDNDVRLWEVGTGKELFGDRAHHDGVGHVGLSPDGKTLFTKSGKARHFWDVNSGKELPWPIGAGKDVQEICFSPDGRRAAGVTEGGLVHLWDIGRGKVIGRYKAARGSWLTVCFSPDGTLLGIAGMPEKRDSVWDVLAGKELSRLNHAPHSLSFLAISPDRKRLATAIAFYQLSLWDLEKGEAYYSCQPHKYHIYDCAFSPDGKAVATCGMGGVILRDAKHGKEIRRLVISQGDTRCLAFSPDGRLLVTGGDDRTLRLWDAGTGQLRRQVTGHEGIIWTVCFSADGRRLASGSRDNTALVWDVGELLGTGP
jgi:WD40 repeat protein